MAAVLFKYFLRFHGSDYSISVSILVVRIDSLDPLGQWFCQDSLDFSLNNGINCDGGNRLSLGKSRLFFCFC